MCKIILSIMVLFSFSASAATSRCNLQVTGVDLEDRNYLAQMKAMLIAKNYNKIQFIERSDPYKKLVLHFGTENAVLNFNEKAWMVLADETKFSTDEKYLYSNKIRSYRIGSKNAFLELLEDLPACR